jgi:Fe2+ or Zn2+ uptake regulation protein
MSCGKRLAEKMRAQGFRVTAQRTIILETIAHMDGHLSAQQVFEQAASRRCVSHCGIPKIHMGTSYAHAVAV